MSMARAGGGGKRMKKRIAVFLCAAAVLCAALLPRQRASAANEPVYLLAINDKMCDLPGGLLPVVANGTVCVPYMVFDKAITGVDLGVYYGLSQEQGLVLSLYSSGGLYLTFQVSMGVCEDKDGNLMNFQAVTRNGTTYVPASAVCGYFGLSYSFLPTTDRGTLIRISNGASLSDSAFLSSVSLAMTYRYNQILQSRQPPATPSASAPASGTAAPGTPSPSATPAPGTATREDVRLYLAVDASQAPDNLPELFPAGTQGTLMLFTPESLTQRSALVRRVVAAGYPVGLRVSGETAQEASWELERGNELLRQIARTRTRIVSAPEEAAEQLAQEGWLCWRADVSGASSGAIMRALERRQQEARVTLPGTAGVISRVLEQVMEARYDLRESVETGI